MESSIYFFKIVIYLFIVARKIGSQLIIINRLMEIPCINKVIISYYNKNCKQFYYYHDFRLFSVQDMTQQILTRDLEIFTFLVKIGLR